MPKVEELNAEVQRLQVEYDQLSQKLLAAQSKLDDVTSDRDKLKVRVAELETELVSHPVAAPVVPFDDGAFKEFPKMLYFKGDPKNYQEVKSAEAEEALGEDWIDSPVSP